MPDLARFRPVLWAAIGVCLVAGLVAVPVVDDGGGDTVTAGSRSTSTTATSEATTTVVDPAVANGGDGGDPAAAPADGAGPSTNPAAPPAPAGDGVGGGGAGGPATTAAPAATAPPTTAAPSEDLGPPSDPGPARPPRAGVYRYKLTARGETRDTTTTIEDRGTVGSETKQLVKTRGEGFDIDSDVAWRPDGVHVLSSVIMFGTNKGSCDWEPDTLQLRLPAAKGTAWESASTCSMTGIGATPIPVSRKITGRYVELRRVRIAGQVVDVWAIEGTERLEAAGRTTDRSGTTLFSPKHGFSVSSSGTITSSEGTTEYRNEVQNLDPE